MKTQELRIRNFIYKKIHKKDTPLELVEVLSIDGSFDVLDVKNIDGYITEQCPLKDFEPIPLTEEWLLKFGFKVKDRKSNLDTNIFYIPTFEIDYCLFYADFRLDYGLYVEYTDSPFPEDDEKLYPITFGIKYVHQLQNLLYGLTGEELTIKQD
jgi:hypothetical protein